MQNLNRKLSTKTQNVEVYLNPSRAFIIVALYDAGQFEPKAEFRLVNSPQHNAKLANYKTLNAIVKYAVAHQISDILKELIVEQSQEQNALEGEPSEQLLPSDNCGSPSTLSPSYGAVSSPTTSPTLYEPLFVETATTGLNPYDEICAICVLDANERVIYETLVKPSVPISRGATAYHDITNEMVANAPTYDKIHKRLKKIFGKSILIFYNAEFDTQCIAQTASIAFDAEHHLTFRDCFPRNKVFCLMQGYAHLWGDYTYSDYDPVWQPLTRACKQQSIYLDDLPITDKSPIANAKRASRLFAKCFKDDLPF